MKQSIVLTLGLACGTFLNVNAHVPTEKGPAMSVSQQIPLDSIQLSVHVSWQIRLLTLII